MTSMPFWNLTPWTTFGNWFSPFNRRHVFAAALTSLNTISLAVFADRAPFVRTVRWRTVANTLSIGFVTGMRITVPARPAWIALVLAYGVTIRDEGHREHVSGQADAYA